MFPVTVVGVLLVAMTGSLASTQEFGFPHPECLRGNEEPPKMIHDPQECSRFLLCIDGLAYNGSCPQGMHFNKDLGVCDLPQFVGCQKVHSTEEPQCPQKNGRVATLLPHRTDCDSFYFCDRGHPTGMKCPEGLHFNPRMSLCDIPERAKCKTASQSHSASTGIHHPNCPSKDPPQPVILPHSLDCSKFYICSNGLAFEKICLSGLFFNPKIRVCDFPRNVKCANAPRAAEKPQCPEKIGKMATLLPHETDCNSYYVCESEQQMILMHCPDDLHFNRKLSVCDFPEEAKCENVSGKNVPVTDSKKDDANQVQPTGSPHPFCPSINGKYPVFFPHPSNCSMYFMCGNGLAYEHACPSGLHFNKKKKVCDFPVAAGCLKSKQLLLASDEPECPPRNKGMATLLPHKTDCTYYYMCESGQPILRECPDDLHFNPHKKVCDFPDMAGCRVGKESRKQIISSNKKPECPPRNKGMATLLPHEEDCTYYYICESGEAILRECPHELHFNPHKKVCDYPDMAGCQAGKQLLLASDEPECPRRNQSMATLLPHKTDCTYYYMCESGQPILRECPDDLHFNPHKKVCDFPDMAGCRVGKQLLLASDEPECPRRNQSMATLLPHKTDCTYYYMCESGQPILRECPDDLHFNPHKKVCDFPDMAGCRVGKESRKQIISSNKKPECPPRNKGMATLLPHEEDCTYYYICESGEAILRECPHELHFNPHKKVCDYPDMAGCQAGKQLLLASDEPECPRRNQSMATLLPHKTDCTYYYMCESGQPILRECPDDLHFNPHKKVCDFPDMAGCRVGKQLLLASDEPECPRRNQSMATLLPHKTDCTYYYMCESGQPILRECPDDLHFNPHKKVCDFPDMAGCRVGKESCKQIISSNKKPECPPRNKGMATLLPHEEDCTYYYICESGEAILRECPHELHFNPHKKVCDYPDMAGCQAGKQLLLASDEPECPRRNQSMATLLPHKTDCTYYYMCESGQPILRECPDDLHFNPHKKVCDFPDMAGCRVGKESRKQIISSNKKPECPPRNKGMATLLPHEEDCTYYYICESGEAILRECPHDLHFNPHKKVCDYPDMAGCQAGKQK